jgi:hypothetical protein
MEDSRDSGSPFPLLLMLLVAVVALLMAVLGWSTYAAQQRYCNFIPARAKIVASQTYKVYDPAKVGKYGGPPYSWESNVEFGI